MRMLKGPGMSLHDEVFAGHLALSWSERSRMRVRVSVELEMTRASFCLCGSVDRVDRGQRTRQGRES